MKKYLLLDFEGNEKNLLHKNNNQISTKKENLEKAKITLYFSCVFFALSSLSIKIMNNYRNDYNYNLFSTIRFMIMFLLSFQILKNKNIKVESFFNIKNLKWILIRAVSNHLSLLCFTISLLYIRLSTATCVYMIYPIFTNILSVFFFKEKFYLKYLIGCLLCLIGCVCFLFSEKNSTNKDGEIFSFTFTLILGIIFSLLDGFFLSIVAISSKFLMMDYDSIEINMFIGLYLSIFSFFYGFVFSLESFINDIFDLRLVIYSLINGFVVYGAFHFLNISSNLADLSKVSYINYSQVVMNILFGIIFFGESFGIVDLLGFILIVGTNVYLTFTMT